MCFVLRVLHRVSDGSYIVDGTTHETELQAKHQFHSVMNTYAYGANSNYDYVRCSVETDIGCELMRELDDRRPVEPDIEPEPEGE